MPVIGRTVWSRFLAGSAVPHACTAKQPSPTRAHLRPSDAAFRHERRASPRPKRCPLRGDTCVPRGRRRLTMICQAVFPGRSAAATELL
jgi:hypothetical protein